ncbi:MAG: hypothetical protein JJ979_03590 [Roseibium sp.]|nr:hypothetical protein [Roseibium sp.]
MATFATVLNLATELNDIELITLLHMRLSPERDGELKISQDIAESLIEKGLVRPYAVEGYIEPVLELTEFGGRLLDANADELGDLVARKVDHGSEAAPAEKPNTIYWDDAKNSLMFGDKEFDPGASMFPPSGIQILGLFSEKPEAPEWGLKDGDCGCEECGCEEKTDEVAQEPTNNVVLNVTVKGRSPIDDTPGLSKAIAQTINDFVNRDVAAAGMSSLLRG